MQRMLVTGGCGFIGSNFIRLELQTNPNLSIINVDKLTYAGNLENLADFQNDSRYQFARGDICDKEFINSLLKDGSVDAVVNFAAESHVDRSILDSSPFVQTILSARRTCWIAAASTRSSATCKSPPTKSMAAWVTTESSPKKRPWHRTALIPPPKPRPICWYGRMSTRSIFRP
jgi:dTDP-D-glucose 4,6-dehydratase